MLWWKFASTFLVAYAQAHPRVDLGYATYEGTSLPDGVDQFLGMRFAAPPVGKNRFRRPQPPQAENATVLAKEHGPVCHGVDGLPLSSATANTSEDCLFVDVFAPRVANRSSAEGHLKGGLPVLLWFQGGAFVELFNFNYNGTGLVKASGGNVIVVTFNYRIGPYGFLATSELREEGNLNVGLHDQRAAIRWVMEHIAQFGGDPDNISLFGTSIGAGGVLLQTLMYGGNPPPEDHVQWQTGMAGSVYLPTVHQVEEVEFQYAQLLKATGCDDLACLRSLDSAQIQAANVGRPVPGQSQIQLFPYGPVIDGQLLTDVPSAMLRAGNFTKDKPLILGSSHSEGTIFASAANTTEDVNAFLQTQFPDLTSADLARANQLYADIPISFPGVSAEKAPLYYRLSAMFGDVSFACPTIDFATQLRDAGANIYLFRNNILDPVEVMAGFIVPHTWETLAIWGPEYARNYVALPGADSYKEGAVNHVMVELVQRYWLNLARSGDVMNGARENATSRPRWRDFRSGQRLKLQANATRMEHISRVEKERCAFWESLSERTHI